MQQAYTVGDTTTYSYTALDELAFGVGFPESAGYEHISYGLWAGLDEDGEAAAALGIGFVDGSGMTVVDDMPNFGVGEYAGNWVATVQAADREGDGPITSPSNTALAAR